MKITTYHNSFTGGDELHVEGCPGRPGHGGLCEPDCLRLRPAPGLEAGAANPHGGTLLADIPEVEEDPWTPELRILLGRAARGPLPEIPPEYVGSATTAQVLKALLLHVGALGARVRELEMMLGE